MKEAKNPFILRHDRRNEYHNYSTHFVILFGLMVKTLTSFSLFVQQAKAKQAFLFHFFLGSSLMMEPYRFIYSKTFCSARQNAINFFNTSFPLRSKARNTLFFVSNFEKGLQSGDIGIDVLRDFFSFFWVEKRLKHFNFEGKLDIKNIFQVIDDELRPCLRHQHILLIDVLNENRIVT